MASETACLLIADISGYTGYLAGVEIERAQDILADLIGTIVSALRPGFRLAKLEGDAAFTYAITDRIGGSLLRDTIERCYVGFRRRRRDVRQATSHECNACVRIPDLNLKFVVHHGTILRQRVAGLAELLGSDGIVAHCLLKHTVVEAPRSRRTRVQPGLRRRRPMGSGVIGDGRPDGWMVGYRPTMAFVAGYALAATGLALALVALLHVLEPEFDPSWRMLSEYSLGRYGVLMRVAFLAVGTGVVALASALSAVAWPSTLALVLVAIGPLGAAFVDTDPITTPRAEVSRRSEVHAVLGMLFILGFPVAATVVGLSAAGDPTVGPLLAWASVAPWVALAWFLGTDLRHAHPDGVGAPDVPIGWPNRVSLLAYLGWVALAAVMVLRR